MPKVKTHSASKKRFKITATGKVKMSHAFRSHRLISKARKAKKAPQARSLCFFCRRGDYQEAYSVQVRALVQTYK
jgi:ribosomal protein L35